MTTPLSLAAQRQAIEHCLALLRSAGSTAPEIIGAAYAGVETLRWLEGRADLVRSIAREVAGPKPLWRQYWGWRNHLVKRAGKSRAGRLLDGREWSEMPSAPEAHD